MIKVERLGNNSKIEYNGLTLIVRKIPGDGWMLCREDGKHALPQQFYTSGDESNSVPVSGIEYMLSKYHEYI